MRDDMNKVLTERPRKGWHVKTPRGNKPRVREYIDEDSYARELRPRRVQSKWFDDHLGPLRRWLRSQVNRPWDKVWSELVAGIDSRTVTGRHLLDHARWEVASACRIDEDGLLYQLDHFGRREAIEGLYVHPRTRLLRWKTPKSRKTPREYTYYGLAPLYDASGVALGDGRFRLRLRGIWYAVDAARLEWSSQRRTTPDFVHLGSGWRIVAKRQLGKRELRDSGLENDAS